MKTVSVAAGTMLALAMTTAHAADVAVRRAAPAPAPAYVVAAPVYNWTGWYIGGHAGWGKADSDWTFENNSFWNSAPGDRIAIRPDGWLGGGQIGVNYQFGTWLAGLEATLAGGSLKDTVVSPYFPASDTEQTKISSLYTVAGRLGVVWNNLLIYGKGGWAGGQVGLSASCPTCTPSGWNPGKESRSGWILGAGLEWMWTPNWIVGVEYNRIDFGSKTHSALNNDGVNLTTVSEKTTVDTVVGRISYLFR